MKKRKRWVRTKEGEKSGGSREREKKIFSQTEREKRVGNSERTSHVSEKGERRVGFDCGILCHPLLGSPHVFLLLLLFVSLFPPPLSFPPLKILALFFTSLHLYISSLSRQRLAQFFQLVNLLSVHPFHFKVCTLNVVI